MNRSTLLCLALLLPSATWAGPTEDRLRDMAGAVPTPTWRPFDAPANLSPKADAAETGQAAVAASSCLARLRAIARAEPSSAPASKDAGCAIPEPVVLSAIAGSGGVSFTEGLLLDCPFALAMAGFVRDTVQPLAVRHVGQQLESIGSGQGYVCRRRNNARTGKLSEHAVGNAMDIVSFRFADGRSFGVQKRAGLKRADADFQEALRKAACGSFTTVLGPGANAAHATHLHFDLGRTKGGKKNPYRICE